MEQEGDFLISRPFCQTPFLPSLGLLPSPLERVGVRRGEVMISKPTIARIFDASRIEEVVGDFLTLKKRGVNYIACCPFHNEKTPSFNVNPVRNIYKCFGRGKGGDSVSFVMEHEKMNYTESLRYLAKKYNIEIEETYDRNVEEEKKQETERESLYVVCSYAQKYFSDSLLSSD